MDKKIDILNQDWDILVILDACRYDLFGEVYKEFFNQGKLRKAISPATWTIEWFNKIFDGEYYDDIIYISSNVFLNSKKKMTHTSKGDTRSFFGKNHFFKVIDVWDWGWNKRTKTIHPRKINAGFIKYYLKYPKKRFILHYIQPHQPYLTLPKEEISNKQSKVKSSLLRQIGNSYLPEEINWKIKKILNISPSEIEKIYREKGWNGIKEIYKNEIRLVLNHVKILTDSISANFLITADHGERLGEHLFRNRHGGKRDKEVIEVPWFELKK